MADNYILESLGFKTTKSAQKDEIPQLQAIDARLTADQERRNSQGLIARGIDGLLQTVWHSDVDSQKKLETLRQQVVDAQAHNDVAAIQKLDPEIAAAVKADEQAAQANGFRDGVSNFVTDTAITSTYFVRGARGRTAATVLTGVNDIHPEDGAVGMVGDGLLGATRGYVMARTFDALGRTKFSAAGKGVSIGLASRLEDGLLNAQTYKGPDGHFSLQTGLENTAASVTNPYAIAADAATFGLAHGAGKVLDTQFAGVLSKNPMAANVFAGFTMGTLSGANNEIQNESKTGNYSATNIFEQALLGGASNASSAALGARLENTRAFAPGTSLFRPGQRPDGSTMLPQPEREPGVPLDAARPGDFARAGDTTAGAAGNQPGGQAEPIPPVSKMQHIPVWTPGSVPVEVFRHKPEVKIENNIVARFVDEDSVQKAGYQWFDGTHMNGDGGQEIYLYVRGDSPDVYAAVPEANGFSVRKVDGLTAVSPREVQRQHANQEQLRQWHNEAPVDTAKVEQTGTGRTEYSNANLSFESKELDTRAARTFDGARLDRFNRLRGDFEEEALRRGLNQESIALLYKQLNRLLADDPNAKLPLEQRRDLAEQILTHSTHPETVDQGGNSTCTVAGVEKRNYSRTPDKNAQVLADLALTGKTVTVSGHELDLNDIPRALRPDFSATANMAAQNGDTTGATATQTGRDFSSQLLETAFVNDYWRINRAFVLEGQFITYDNFAFDANHNFQGIVRDPSKRLPPGMSVPGSVDVYNGDGQLIGAVMPNDLTPLYDASGRRITRQSATENYFNQKGQEVWSSVKPGDLRYTMMPSQSGDVERMQYRRPGGNWQILRNSANQFLSDPMIRTDQLTELSNDFTNANEGPFVIANNARPGVLGASTPQEFANQIDNLRSEQRLPALSVVAMDHPLFNRGRQHDGGLHVVMVHDLLSGLDNTSTTGVSPDDMRVLYSNQWGPDSHYLNPGVLLPYFSSSMKF